MVCSKSYPQHALLPAETIGVCIPALVRHQLVVVFQKYEVRDRPNNFSPLQVQVVNCTRYWRSFRDPGLPLLITLNCPPIDPSEKCSPRLPGSSYEHHHQSSQSKQLPGPLQFLALCRLHSSNGSFRYRTRRTLYRIGSKHGQPTSRTSSLGSKLVRW